MISVPMESQPQYPGVTHLLEMFVAESTDNLAMRIRDWLKQPVATLSTERCHICGAVFTIPDGDIKGHITKYLAELGGEEAYIHLQFRHKGPRPSTLPPGIKMLSAEEVQELKAKGKVIPYSGS